MKSIVEAIREALLERGWTIDLAPVEDVLGECLEFIHPETQERLAWRDAILAQQEREWVQAQEQGRS